MRSKFFHFHLYIYIYIYINFFLIFILFGFFYFYFFLFFNVDGLIAAILTTTVVQFRVREPQPCRRSLACLSAQPRVVSTHIFITHTHSFSSLSHLSQLFAAMIAVDTHQSQRERSRSPRRGRSRSPGRPRRRSYSPRSRSRSRDDYRRNERRSRSPMSGAAGGSGGLSGSAYGGAPRRSYEER